MSASKPVGGGSKLPPAIHVDPGASIEQTAPTQVKTPGDRRAEDSFEGGAPTAVEPSSAAKIEARIAAGLGVIADPFIISSLINGTGTAIIHYSLGVPVDPKVVATFQVVGTTIGASYFPLKAMLQDALSGKKPDND